MNVKGFYQLLNLIALGILSLSTHNHVFTNDVLGCVKKLELHVI